MPQKLKLFMILGTASSCIFSGSSLTGLSLAFDAWRIKTVIDNRTNMTIVYQQGLRQECKYKEEKKLEKTCYDWSLSTTPNVLIQCQELLLYAISAASAMGFLSLIISLAASTSRAATLVIPTTAFELASVLMNASSLALYTIYFITKPWSPGISYYILWSGTVLFVSGLINHAVVGDVTFFGKKCFVQPTTNYRYHKASDTIIEV